MDNTFTEKKSKRRSKGEKKSRKSKKETLPSTPFIKEEAPVLDDILSHELQNNKVTVNKSESAPPLDHLQAVQAPVAAAVTGEEATATVIPSEEATDDIITSGEVLDTVQTNGKQKSNRAGSGDYGAAYHELYTQLCMRMLNRIYRYFQRLYKKCGNDEKKFKKSLEEIQKWNQAEINRRAKEIVEIYPDTEAYFRYAYAANVMLMSVVVQRSGDSEDLEIEVPRYSSFIHNAYVESARVLYDNPGVLSSNLPDKDKLRIREELLSCFSKAVATALRMMVPLDHIAPKSGLDTTPLETFGDSDSDESGSEEESSEEESSEEESSEEESGSEESGSEESGSEEESETEDESSEEERVYDDIKKKKRVKASRRSLETPDDLLIDQ